MTYFQGQDINIRIGDNTNPALSVFQTLQGITLHTLRLEARHYITAYAGQTVWQEKQGKSGQIQLQLNLSGIYSPEKPDALLQSYMFKQEHFPLEISFSSQSILGGMGIMTRFERRMAQHQPERYNAVISNAGLMTLS